MNTELNGLRVHHLEHVMGTAVSFDIRMPLPADEAIVDAVAWLHHVDATFSTYRDSEITRLGRGEIRISDLDQDTHDVLMRCIELTDVTGGAFDAFAVPAPNGTSLDPSGLVKGWSVERVAGILESYGAANFCVNAGGDVVVRGAPTPGSAWRVGIRDPDRGERLALVLEASGEVAIATSATYERGAHIIDPSSQQPTTGVASVTVVGPDLGTADAFATASFVMGIDSIGWITTQPGYDVFLITHDNLSVWSPGMVRWAPSLARRTTM